jgi:hypothetical protein
MKARLRVRASLGYGLGINDQRERIDLVEVGKFATFGRLKGAADKTRPFQLQKVHFHQRPTDASFLCQLTHEGTPIAAKLGDDPQASGMGKSLKLQEVITGFGHEGLICVR